MTRARLFVTLFATAVLGTTGWWGWRNTGRQRTVAQHLPSVPALTGWPATLADQITDAENEARSWSKSVSGLATLSRLYHANGFFAEALLCYDGLRELQPREARWPHLAAGIHALYGRAEEALPLYRRATALAPDYLPAWIRLGDVLVKANQPAEAARAYEEALRRAPGQPYALLGLARSAVARGDWNEARTRLNDALARHPEFIGALSLLVTVSEHFADRATADALRERIGRREFTDLPDPWLDGLADVCFDAYRLSVTAAIASSAGDPTRALELLDAAIVLAPRNSSFRRQAAQIHFNGRNFAAARAHLEQAVAANAGDSDAWLLLISTLRELGQTEAAVSALSRGLTHCPQSPSLRLDYARWLKATGRLEDAAVEFRRGYELRPSESSPLVELAQVLFATGRNSDALAALHLALERQPGHPMAQATLTFYAISQRDEAEALRRWADVRRQTKTPPEVVRGLQQAFQQQFGRLPP
ncbi:tetratricopeptide repeat protein [Oleiharenicola lentus]|uniref:Tetratricopeptide repeat protein n=1 Tax=Oleiharenicola lentus TaxID=2508720 RepID=A0A4Q1C7W6_9BACT|nr:tetratricopeptide repeat protein [Oleiharenicola lentus]RXK54901.1 tetratricopeptide repeat protein [Oleiharenicola lentus]